MDGLADLFRAVGAVVLADDHAGTAGHPQKEADERIDDGRYRSHGGEGLVADEVAHHPCVHHVVQLLEQIARQQRQGKADEVPRGVALRHVHIVAGVMPRMVVQMEVEVMLHDTLSFVQNCLLRYHTIHIPHFQRGICIRNSSTSAGRMMDTS